MIHSSTHFPQAPSKNGFTMIELLVVTTIIIVLSAIGLVSFQRTGQNARNGRRKADLETLRQSLVLYRTDNGAYPIGSYSGSSMTNLLTEIADYVSSGALVDPRDEGAYVYSYTADSPGATFLLCAQLEPDPGTQYCVDNP